MSMKVEILGSGVIGSLSFFLSNQPPYYGCNTNSVSGTSPIYSGGTQIVYVRITFSNTTQTLSSASTMSITLSKDGAPNTSSFPQFLK